jgi:hypothetical protein
MELNLEIVGGSPTHNLYKRCRKSKLACIMMGFKTMNMKKEASYFMMEILQITKLSIT